MKVAIINPPILKVVGYIREGRCEQRLSSFQYVMLPVSIVSVAGVLLKESFEVRVYDCIAEEINLGELKRYLIEFSPKLFVFNISTPTYYQDLKIIAEVKKSFNKHRLHFTAIGVHVSALPEETLIESELDSVVRHEPELTMLELAKCLKEGRNLTEIAGISYKLNVKIFHNPNREFITDLNSLPFPARQLINNEKYLLPVVNQPYTLILPSRGCLYECIFCTASIYYGKKLRMRQPENIVNELSEIVNKFNIKYVTMWSDTFVLDREFVLEICNGIKSAKLNFYWMCNARVDKVDQELLSLMKSAGYIGISYGVESGVQDILDRCKKKITLKQIENAFYWTKKASIETLAHVIFGLPGETKETIKQTIKFVKKLDLDYIQFYCAIPFPGTELYKIAIENSWITTFNWEQYEINNAILSTEKLTKEELTESRIKAYREFYLRPKYFLRRLKAIHSINDLFLTIKQAVSFARGWILNI